MICPFSLAPFPKDLDLDGIYNSLLVTKTFGEDTFGDATFDAKGLVKVRNGYW